MRWTLDDGPESQRRLHGRFVGGGIRGEQERGMHDVPDLTYRLRGDLGELRGMSGSALGDETPVTQPAPPDLFENRDLPGSVGGIQPGGIQAEPDAGRLGQRDREPPPRRRREPGVGDDFEEIPVGEGAQPLGQRGLEDTPRDRHRPVEAVVVHCFSLLPGRRITPSMHRVGEGYDSFSTGSVRGASSASPERPEPLTEVRQFRWASIAHRPGNRDLSGSTAPDTPPANDA